MPGKRVQIDEETWAALRLLAQDRMATFQELSEEAFRDLLEKHGRAADLRSQLKKSAGADEAPAAAASEGREARAGVRSRRRQG
jgi:hypothetical protein